MTHPAMDLRALLENMARVPGVANREVRGLQTDSRRVQPGDLFLALPGMVADGRDHIGDAVASGACASSCVQVVLPLVPVTPITTSRREGEP